MAAQDGEEVLAAKRADGGRANRGHRGGARNVAQQRDPDAFRDPDVFDIRRADGGRHLGFGHGIHFCLGAGLGRLEGRVMFARLAEQLPTLRLAEDPGAGGWIEPHFGALALMT